LYKQKTANKGKKRTGKKHLIYIIINKEKQREGWKLTAERVYINCTQMDT
jgi:hypothetical protein